MDLATLQAVDMPVLGVPVKGEPGGELLREALMEPEPRRGSAQRYQYGKRLASARGGWARGYHACNSRFVVYPEHKLLVRPSFRMLGVATVYLEHHCQLPQAEVLGVASSNDERQVCETMVRVWEHKGLRTRSAAEALDVSHPVAASRMRVRCCGGAVMLQT